MRSKFRDLQPLEELPQMGVTLDQDFSALNILLQGKNLADVDATMLVRILATAIS